MEKIEFEILRDKDRRPTVTICTIQANGESGIGMAIRSLRDNPVERVGRAKAYGRAKKALYRRSNSLPIFRDEALASLDAVNQLPRYKGEFINKSVYVA